MLMVLYSLAGTRFSALTDLLKNVCICTYINQYVDNLRLNALRVDSPCVLYFTFNCKSVCCLSCVRTCCITVLISFMQFEKEWQDVTSGGHVYVTDLSEGEHIFVCTVQGHCNAGMHMKVVVTGGNKETVQETPRGTAHLVRPYNLPGPEFSDWQPWVFLWCEGMDMLQMYIRKACSKPLFTM